VSQEIKEISLRKKSGRDQYVEIIFKDGTQKRYLIKNFPYLIGGPVITGSYKVKNIPKK